MIFRTKRNVPEVYANESRDFQLLCNLYDCIINGTRFYSETLTSTLSTEYCNESMLKLLSEKLGFFTEVNFNSNVLRKILSAFPDIVKYKGSLEGIKRSIFTYFHIINKSTELFIAKNPETHIIQIGLEDTNFNLDTTILDEILKYVMPVNYSYTIYKYEKLTIPLEEFISESKLKLLYTSRSNGIFSSDDTSLSYNNFYKGVDTSSIYNSDNKASNDMFTPYSKQGIDYTVGIN